MKLSQFNAILLLSIILTSSIALHAQNSDSFFKDIPRIDSKTPDWAVMMYSENPNVNLVEKAYTTFYRSNTFEKNIHTQNYKYWLRSIAQITNAQGYIVQLSASEEKKKIKKLRKLREDSPYNKSMTTVWNNIGPFNTYSSNGNQDLIPTQTNVYCIAAAPSNPDILYCGTEGGGFYKSIDHGLNWSLTSLDESFTSGADVKIHPTDPDIVYIATQDDIFKTTDGGTTWSLSVDTPGTVEQLYIHKTEPHKVFAATSNGLYYTDDSGANWSDIRPGRHWDIEANPENPNTIYLSTKNEIDLKAEIFKSTNAGATWTLKDTDWYVPTDLAFATDGGCKIGLTPIDTNRVYACLLGNSKDGDQGWIGVYYSLDGADTWVDADGQDGGPYATGNDPATIWYCNGYPGGYHQGWYNFDLDVSHNDPDRIWVGTIWDLESNNRGGNFESVRDTRGLLMHADVQDIDVVGNDIWIVSDGGINYSNDELQTTETRNTGVTASNFWAFTQGWNEDTWAGGRYHNGDAVYHENFGVGNTMYMGGAESATGFINQFENRKSYYNDISSKILPDALSMSATSFPKLAMYPNSSYSQLMSSEIEHDPRYGTHIYMGKDNVFYKSTDTGASFSALYSFPTGSIVYEFEISRINPDIIYCLVQDNGAGIIYKSIDGGTSFNPVSTIPSNSISSLDLSLDQENPDHLWVISRYGSNGNKVYATTDGGTTWTNKTTPVLNGQQFVDIDYQTGSNDIVYLLSFDAVFYYDANTADWVVYSDGLPLVLSEAREIELFYRDSKIRFSGARGIWEAPFAGTSYPSVQPMTHTDVVLCSRDTVQMDCYSHLDHEGATWQWIFSPTPAYIDDVNARNPKVVFDQEGSYDLTLTVSNIYGTSSKTVSNFISLEDNCSPDPFPGHAMQVVGAGDYAQVESVDITTTNFTVSAWVKLNGIQPIYSSIVMNDGVSAGFNFRNNNELAYHWPGGAWWWDSGLIVPQDEWAHVAMVATPTGMTLYLNGEASFDNNSLDPAEIGAMKIGSYKGWSGRNMNGEIDEVAIWNRSLSQEEIREIRHLTRNLEMPVAPDLMAYYQFNYTESTTILDKVAATNALQQGNANKMPSSAPVAGGEVHRLSVNASGNYVFGTTGVEMSFGAVVPDGEIVVSRLDTFPNILPVNTPNGGNYWVINNYGDATFDALTEMKFTPIDADYVDSNLGSPESARLYKRTSNDHLDQWSDQCGAIAAANGVLSYNNSCDQISFSQFFIADKICTAFLALTGMEIDPNLVEYEAQNIESTQTIDVGSQVTYDAEDILLAEGFSVETGSDFYAYIDGCGNANSFGTGNIEQTSRQLTTNPDGQEIKNGAALSIDFVQGNKLLVSGSSSDRPGRLWIYNNQGKLKMDLMVKHQKETIDVSSLAVGQYHFLLRVGTEMKTGNFVVGSKAK